MTKEEYLSIAGQKYDALRELHKHDNFYDYEKEFEKIIKDLGRQVLEANLSELSNDRRKKKL
jgi:predicted transcriptional regulator